MPIVELLLFLLLVAAGLEMLSRRSGVPRPVLLVLAGGVLALLPGVPRVQAAPDLVLFIFIPPLIYWAATTTTYRDFRRNLRPIALLAVGLVLATAAVVAVVAHTACAALPWPSAFALGAAVAPTDAVAATAVMRRLGVPRDLESVLEGESLLNDATSLVVFEMAIAAGASGASGAFSLGAAALRLLWSAAGGIAIGLAAGWAVTRLRAWLARAPDADPVVESTVSLLTPFVAYVPADRVGASGVLAVVVIGLYVGHTAPRVSSAETRLQATDVWKLLDFLLEGLIFMLVGLALPVALGAPGDFTPIGLVGIAALVSAVVIVTRLAGVFPIAYLPPLVARWLHGERAAHAAHPAYPPYPSWREVTFGGWAGLRGAVSLVLALSVPLATATGTPFPGRNLVIFLTFAVILVTLVGQGLTLAPAIRLLGLEPDRVATREEAVARWRMARAGLSYLDRMLGDGDVGEPGARADATDPADDALARSVAAELRDRQVHRVHRYAAGVHGDAAVAPGDRGATATREDEREAEREADRRRARTYRRLRLDMIATERRELVRLRDDGVIGDDALHRLERDLDLEAALLSTGESRRETSSRPAR